MATSDTVKNGPIFYILCGNAAYNRGDRGNLLSQLALLKERFPTATLVFASDCPEIDRNWYNAIVLRASLLPNSDQRRWMKKADIIVCGGGALLADNSCRVLVPYWFFLIFYCKMILRKPVMIWANGIVLETQLGKFFGKLALNLADRITVRDAGSYNSCKELGIKKPYEQTADPGVLLSPAAREEGQAILAAEGIPQDKPLFCISPTFWHIYHDKKCWLPYPMGKRFTRTTARHAATLEQYKKGIARLAALASQRFGAHILLMPRYANPAWDDIRHCRDIAQMANLPGAIHILENDSYPPQHFFALWKCFAMTISVAMHDAIFAIVMDTPVLHLHYESKGRDLFKFLDASELMMPWETLLNTSYDEEILTRIANIMQQWDANKEVRHKAVANIQHYARRNADVLAQLYQEIEKRP